MKILKIILLVIVIIIAIPLIIALFVKKEYVIAREAIINRPATEIYNYVKLLKNQDDYSKWVRTDPAMKKDFRGNDGTEGFVYAWNGNDKAGEGEQEIKSLQPNKKVTCEIRFKRPMESVAYTNLVTDAISPTQTKVTWSMEGKSYYPFNFANLFMGGILGNDLDSSLHMLKAKLEN